MFLKIPFSQRLQPKGITLNVNLTFFNVKTNLLKNFFFPVVITATNNFDVSIRNSSSCHIFKKIDTEVY